jgi:hypothetical protein
MDHISNISFHIGTVNNYLKDSELYKHLIDCYKIENKVLFTIPTKYYKFNSSINSINYLFYMLDTIKYWRLNTVPDSLYNFVFSNKTLIRDNIEKIKINFYELFVVTEIELIINSKDEDILNYAIQYNLYNLTKYLKAIKFNEFINLT